MKYKIFDFVELLISLEEYYQWEWENTTQKRPQKYLEYNIILNSALVLVEKEVKVYKKSNV